MKKANKVNVNITNLIGTLVIVGEVKKEECQKIEQSIMNAISGVVKSVESSEPSLENQE